MAMPTSDGDANRMRTTPVNSPGLTLIQPKMLRRVLTQLDQHWYVMSLPCATCCQRLCYNVYGVCYCQFVFVCLVTTSPDPSRHHRMRCTGDASTSYPTLSNDLQTKPLQVTEIQMLMYESCLNTLQASVVSHLCTHDNTR